MNRQFSNNLSYLEAAKHAIEHFAKFHSKAPKSDSATFILATYDQKNPIKSCDGGKELLDVLKNLQATDSSDAGNSFSALFEYLNAIRVCSGGDVPGKGRYPALQDSTLIFWLSDGTPFSSSTSVDNQINIPLGRTSQSSGFLEPFRWEQRLYTIVLGGDQGQNPLIGALADSMGGQTWKITSLTQLTHCIDNCFETRHPNTPPFMPLCHIEGVSVSVRLSSAPDIRYKLFLYANRTVSSFFPIPEAFWPEAVAKRSGDPFSLFSKRAAHPMIYVSTKDELCPIFEGFPCERLSMEQVEFTQELMKRPRNTCWLAYIENSGQKPGLGQPFGFFKVTKNGQSVNLYILPYNFKRLFSLLNSGALFKNPNQIPAKFINSFVSYLRDTPPYQWPNIRKGMEMVKLSHLWPSKTGIPDILNEIDVIHSNLANVSRSTLERTRALVKGDHLKSSAANFDGRDGGMDADIIENVFDVSRDELEKQFRLSMAKLNTRKSRSQQIGLKLSYLSQDELDDLHSVSIEKMGQYKEKMDALQKNLPRDPNEDEESTKRRQDTLFGNPYFKKKRTSSKQQEYPSIGSPDSIMNEADEEASHEFEKELTNPDLFSSRRKRHLGKRKSVPYLYKKPLLSVPSFKGLGDLAVESVVKELEQAPTTPSNTDPSPDSASPSDSGIRSRMGQDFIEVVGVSPSLPDLDDKSSTAINSETEETERDSIDTEVIVPTFSDETDEMLRSDWSYARKMIHDSIAKWPKYFDFLECADLIKKSLNSQEKDYLQRREWITSTAVKFNQQSLIEFLKNNF